ncbi:MAG: methylmalonyl-CoA mutase [Actinophytocola sp.]|uniref:methylmalonyl-CoA mutase family protein n=1 Tax=Actinophytocola sp. TaxID=1872138 RepID=UPI001323B424|nr:methylmalonyl-CoA mutase family protein [Actinophytocola sp.]MPZ83531.1 methylmalonyl-CoA mutase [Actinophytocola sp.]
MTDPNEVTADGPVNDTTDGPADSVAAARSRWEREVLEPALSRFGLDAPADRFYGPDDVAELDFHRSIGFPGQFPFTAGPYPTQPFAAGARGTGLIPQGKGLARAGRYSGYGTAEDTAAYYARMIADGQRAGPNVAFDLPTQCGYDSDDPHALGEVGRAGVAIDSFEDFCALYEPFQGELEVDKVGSNWTINAPATIIVAMYFLLARKRGVDGTKLRGTPQNDILKEFIARGTYIFPPRPSMRLVRDLFGFVTEHLPRLNVVSGGGYHMREAGATRELDLGFSMANGIAYLQTGVDAGIDVDVLAQRITFNAFGGSLELFKEVALQRAARRMWAKITRDRFGAKSPRSWVLRQPNGAHMGYYNATVSRPINNLTRAVVGGIASALSGYGSNVEPPFDEALGLGWSREGMQMSEDAARILQYEAGLNQVRDPLAGSYYVESLTNEIEAAASEVVEQVEAYGGSVGAIEAGFMQDAVSSSAMDRAMAQETGERLVVGVNAFTGPEEIDVRVVTSSARMYGTEQLGTAERRQLDKLFTLRRGRHDREVTRALRALEKAARDPDTNVMKSVVDCVAGLCTVGEICGVLREVFGEYRGATALGH